MKLIVAVDQDNAIGTSGNDLPWKSRWDLRNFKRLTTQLGIYGDLPRVVMGRKTHQSLPVVLSGRISYVLTSSQFQSDTAQSVTLDELPRMQAPTWIIGGAMLYDYVLDKKLITEMHITRVHQSSGGSVKLSHDLYNNIPGWDIAEQIVNPDPELSLTYVKLIPSNLNVQ